MLRKKDFEWGTKNPILFTKETRKDKGKGKKRKQKRGFTGEDLSFSKKHSFFSFFRNREARNCVFPFLSLFRSRLK